MKYIGANIKQRLSSAALVTLLAVSTAGAQDQSAPQVLRIVKGKSSVVTFPERVKTISIADEKIIDVISITPTDVVVIGKAEGKTSLYIWGESGRYMAYDARVDRAVKSQQVVLEVQIAEFNRTKFSDIGFDMLWRDTDDGNIIEGEKAIGSYAGQVSVPDPFVRNIFAQEEMTGIFKWVGSQQTLQVAFRALHERGIIRLLASPRLVCLSGEEASFLVGGEIPVPIPSQSNVAGGLSVAIQWKEFGVKLKFTPMIIDSNLVRLKIAPEVSSLDYSNTVSFAGFEIPAIRTRRASATVELNSMQSVILGGLTFTESLSLERKVPILGHIPIIGALFTKKQKSSSENELMIIVTPRIIETMANETIPPLPGVLEEKSELEEKSKLDEKSE